jgi:hypothetical protein
MFAAGAVALFAALYGFILLRDQKRHGAARDRKLLPHDQP